MQLQLFTKNKTLLRNMLLAMLLGVTSWLGAANVTVRVNMSNETVSGNVYFHCSALGWSNVVMTNSGGGIYSYTFAAANNSTFQYVFRNGCTNGTCQEGGAGAGCNAGPNRVHTTGSIDETLPIVCFGGSCADCASLLSITVRVNMSNVTVSGGVFFHSSLFGWSDIPMTNIGSNIYSYTFIAPPSTTFQYKFKNGTVLEGNAGASCGGGNRFFTTGLSAEVLPTVCFGGSCSDCVANSSLTFRVNMSNETGFSNVYFHSELFGWSNLPMTNIGGGIYSITVSAPTNINFQYIFRKDGTLETGPNRTGNTGTGNTIFPTVCFGGFTTDCISNAIVTLRVNMTNESVGGGGVNIESSLSWGNPVPMTNIGAGVYSVSLTVPFGTTFQYKFKNGTNFEGNAQASCNAGANRVYTANAGNVTLPTVCYGGSCIDCATASTVQTTFRVNMSNEFVGGDVNFASSLNGFADVPMTSIGGGVYSITRTVPVNTVVNYKFKNGSVWENDAQAGCNLGANRTVNSGAADQILPTVCFGGLCNNCATSSAITFQVNMSNETIVGGVFLETSLAWGSPVAMTNIGGNIYATTISVPTGVTLQYKFKNGTTFEGNAQSGCNAGANRTLVAGSSDVTLSPVCFGGSCSNCSTTVDITLRVNMNPVTVDGSGVFFASSLNGFADLAMTNIGGNVYSITVAAPVNAPFQYKFKNGPVYEANAESGCEVGPNRLYSTGSSDATLPTVCFGGSCSDCPTNAAITFQVNAQAIVVSGGIFFASSLNGFTPLAMTNIYGTVYSITVNAPFNTTIQYKFKNGSVFEGNAQAGCNAGANRTYTTGTTAATLPVVCFGGSCSDCSGTVDITLSVNMFFETVTGNVNLSTSLNGFATLLPMNDNGDGTFSVTITAPINTNINYKFRNGSVYEGNAGAGCNTGVNRTYFTGVADATLPTVCYGGSCNNCPTTWTSINSGNWSLPSTWDQNSIPPNNVIVVITGGRVVTLDMNASVKELQISSGGSLIGSDGANRILTIANNGTFINTANFTANSFSQIITGNAVTISGNIAFNNLTINGETTILGTTTVNGILQINSGGYFSGINSPSYGTNSILRYATGGTYGRGLEWNSLSGPGYPRNVEVSAATILQLGANGGQNIERAIAGNLTIQAGCSVYLDWGGLEMTQTLTINGDLIVNGNLSLSSQIGGDLTLRRNFILSNGANFSCNNRSINFVGTTNQTVSGSIASITINYLSVDLTSSAIFNVPVTITNDLLINATSSIIANQNITLQNGGNLYGTLQIAADKVLSVTGGTLSSNGFLRLQSGAILLHGVGTPGGGGAVTGNTRIFRTGDGGSFVYNYVSTPVNNSLLNVLGNTIYYYNPYTSTADVVDDNFDPGWVNATGTMTLGQGYAALSLNNIGFFGPANNGTINFEVGAPNLPNSKINLIGNPYPSPISASAFMAANGPSGSNRITGALYFWDDDLSGGNGFAISDYAVWNGAGSISASGNAPNGQIASAQGFIVEANTTGDIVFNNNMRSASPAVFFDNDGIQRIKLGVETIEGNYNETLIAFIADATEQRDPLYDAAKLAGNPSLSFYSFLEDNQMAIQGLPPISAERTVNLGIHSASTGAHTIKLKMFENIPSSVIAYLHDLELNTFTNLRLTDSYVFTPAQMDLDARFVLKFTAPIEISVVETTCQNATGSISVENPANQQLNYLLSNVETNATIEQGNTANGNFTIGNLSNGNYALQISMEDGYAYTTDIVIGGGIVVDLLIAANTPAVTVGTPIQLLAISNALVNWSLTDGTFIGQGNEINWMFDEPGFYTIFATATAGNCSNIASITLQVLEASLTGIDKTDNIQFILLPNPAHDNAQLLFSSAQERESILVRLFDVAGKIVFEQNTTIQAESIVSIPLESVGAGIYTVSITGASFSSSQKLVVN